jgi:excisionase family DNA binding protein
MTQLPYLLTAHEVAAWLCTTERRVLRMAREGELPHVLLPGGDVMFEPAALVKWLAHQRQPLEEEAV